ncbi:MAG TPA: STAS domain-containing protein [Acidimicrobiales bacterium]
MDDLNAPLSVSTTDTPAGPVITVGGELDASNIDRLRSEVDSQLASRPETLKFDLSGITFMDTSAIALLISTTKTGVPVRILAPSVPVRTVIEMTGLADVLVMEP